MNNVTYTCSIEEYLFRGGDFNCTENAVLVKPSPHAASRSCLVKLVETYELSDV